MSISVADARAVALSITADALKIELDDGRTLSAPLAWFPHLIYGTATERANGRFIGKGEGIHWPDLDEDISIEGLIAGRPSAETAASLERWLASRSR